MANGHVVRRCNRYYTERIGELSGRTAPGGPSLSVVRDRTAGSAVRNLRIGLDLNSGNLARLLRSLERQDLRRCAPILEPDEFGSPL
jgi:hypothetical protein